MANPATILLVDDDDSLRSALHFILEGAGFVVIAAATAEAALRAIDERPIDLALLDVGLPGMDGFTLAQRLPGLPNSARARVVMLTGDGLEDHVVEALESVADDYIVKPARPRLLLARLRAVLRRGPRDERPSEPRLCVGAISLDPGAREAWVEEQRLPLTRTEFDLLELFLRSPGRVFRRIELIEALHGSPGAISERSVDFSIHGLRTKLGRCSGCIRTVRGVGFKLVAAPPADAAP